MNPDSKNFLFPREQFLTLTDLSLNSQHNQLTAYFPNARYSFFWARNALYHALHALRVPPSSSVLLPAFLCRAAAEPFAAYGLKCDYYDVGRDCNPDFGEIQAKLRKETRVLVAVHYFGFPQDIFRLRELCDRNNLLLFEDCAHVLRTQIQGRPLGSLGDASVFSYRKFLPMFDGAELWLSVPKSNLPKYLSQSSRFTLQAAKNILSYAVDCSSTPTAKFLSCAIQASKKLFFGREDARKPSAQAEVDGNSASFELGLVNEPITAPSRWVMNHSDLNAIIARRRENFSYLHCSLARVPGVTPLFKGLPDNVCPWVYPLFAEGIENLHLLLRSAGIPAVTWGGVRIHGISKSEFPQSCFLYDNLIFLPIHQNLSCEQLQLMVSVLKQTLADARGPRHDQIVAEIT